MTNTQAVPVIRPLTPQQWAEEVCPPQRGIFDGFPGLAALEDADTVVPKPDGTDAPIMRAVWEELYRPRQPLPAVPPSSPPARRARVKGSASPSARR